MKINNLTKKDMIDIGRELMKMRREKNDKMKQEDIEHLVQEIYLSIEEELRAAAYYRALADIAPNQFAADMFLEFSQDEREHAYQYKKAYERLTGESYQPEYEYEFEFELEEENYDEYLEERIVEETADFKKYKGYYLMTNNPYLRDIFFNAMHDEAYHAMRQMYLLHMYTSEMGMM